MSVTIEPIEWEIVDNDEAAGERSLGTVRAVDAGVVEIRMSGAVLDAAGWRQLGEAMLRVIEGAG